MTTARSVRQDIIFNQKATKPIDNETESVVPLEIDTHYQLYGKHMWEVEYFERCDRCKKKIDEFGYCACNGFVD